MRILTIGTYPTSEPRHGGQVRVNAMGRGLLESGHEVRHLAFYRADEYPEEPPSQWNITFTWPFINDLISSGRRTDVSASDFLIHDSQIRRRIIDIIVDFSPEIVMFEQCWMWPAWRLMAHEAPALSSARTVYSSQNVEYSLLQQSVAPGGAPVSDQVVELVRRMEIDLVRASDVVLAVSQADAEVFAPYSSNVVVAPNGIWPRSEPTGVDYWRSANLGKFALFVGSAHPPNAAGFMKMLGPSLSYLALDETIVVVGGVCNLLNNDKLFKANLGLNLARSRLVGVQDSGGLSTLIEMAAAVIVPITEGGGTNIKMAEALYNRKPILCTPKAMRGYEEFRDFPFVLARDTPEEYQKALVGLLRGDLKIDFNMSRVQADKLEQLLWPSALFPAYSAVAALA